MCAKIRTLPNTFNMPRNSAEKLIEKHGKTAPELSERLEEGVPARILAGNSGHKMAEFQNKELKNAQGALKYSPAKNLCSGLQRSS